jgi:glycosyltransferase involved in cell wall biosynthesis
MLVRDLVRLQAAEGHRTSIAAFRPSQANFAGELKSLERHGCELHIPERILEKWGRLSWVGAAVKKFRPDIVFAHSILPSAYTRLALRLTRRPAIVTVLHTDDDLGDPALRRLERLVYRRNSCVVGVSPKSVENYQRRTSAQIPAKVIRNGIDIAHFSEPARGHRYWREKVYQAAGDEIIALQVGRMSLQKQQHVSVEALIRLHASGLRNIRLVMAGVCEDADYRQKVLRGARDGGVADKVQLVGPQGNIAEMLAGADLFLMPSGWEAHSVAALEALASGVFCVFSGIEAFADLRSFPGVAMIGALPTGEELGDCLEGVARSKAWDRRFERDLGRFSIAHCASEYMRITEKFAIIDPSLRVAGNQLRE